jgi:hypothetical protein
MIEKYIVVTKDGVQQIFTFPISVDHDRMFEAIGAIRMGSDQDWKREYRMCTAVSAGFIQDGQCCGESESLKLLSRYEIDTALLGTTRSTGAATAPADTSSKEPPHEHVIEALGCDHVAQLCSALNWLGESTYESQEECAARQRGLILRLIHAVTEHRTLFQSNQDDAPALDELTASVILKSIIDDGYLSESTVGRYHNALARTDQDRLQDREALLGLMRVLVEGDTGKNVLWKLSRGQSTETDEGKAWLAAKALVELMSTNPPAGATQRVWVVDDDRGEHVMFCPQKPGSDAMNKLAEQIERNVFVGEFFIFPAKTSNNDH